VSGNLLRMDRGSMTGVGEFVWESRVRGIYNLCCSRIIKIVIMSKYD